MQNRYLISILIALVLVAAIIVLFSFHVTKNPTVNDSLLDKPAPQVSGKNLISGKQITLKELENKFVLVNFFASWCPPCHQEEPQLVTLYSHYKQRVNFLSVAMNDLPTNARSFLIQEGATWPAIDDPSGNISVSFGVTGPPETFLIGPNNIIYAKYVGPISLLWAKNILRKALTSDVS